MSTQDGNAAPGENAAPGRDVTPGKDAAPGRIVLSTTVDVTLGFYSSLIPRLADQGWDVHVVSSPGARLDGFGEDPRVTTHELAMKRSPHPLDALSLAKWVALLRKIRPDVVVVFTPKATLLSMVAARLVGVPVRVYMMQGLRLETAEGMLRNVLLGTEKTATACATHVVVSSDSIAKRAGELGLVDHVTMIGKGSFGIKIDRFPYRPLRKVDPERPVIGFVGRLQKDKGVRELVGAFKLVRQHFPGAQLLLAGSDEGEGKLLEELGEDAYRYLGPVEDPGEVYYNCDVLAMPTYREGFSTVVLEAQLCGTPAVTTDATGAIDAADFGRTARVAKVRDAQSLYEEIMVTLTDEDERARLWRVGRPWAEQFDRAAVARTTEKWLRRVLAEARGK